MPLPTKKQTSFYDANNEYQSDMKRRGDPGYLGSYFGENKKRSFREPREDVAAFKRYNKEHDFDDFSYYGDEENDKILNYMYGKGKTRQNKGKEYKAKSVDEYSLDKYYSEAKKLRKSLFS